MRRRPSARSARTCRRARTWCLLIAGLLLACAALGPRAARAQVPDTTRTDTLRVDTLQVPRDTARADTTEEPGPRALAPGALLPLAAPTAGRPVGDTLPTLRPALDATALLGRWPGAFVYDLGAVGWPHGWSVRGLSPRRPQLLLDGRPFDGLLTGRPRFDLLPLDLLRPLRVGSGTWGAPVTAYAHVRPLSSGRPLTELRYRRGSGSFQGVSVLHTQHRRLTLFDRPAALEVLGAYGGAAGDNAYPGSRLTRERRLYGHLRYRRPAWSLELSNLHNRRFVGAHGGVLPEPGQPFASVYYPTFASVANPDARRRVIRNDLALTLRAPLAPGLSRPLTASAYWTAQTFRYLPGDTAFAARMDRYGLRLAQRARLGRHRLHVALGATLDRPEATPALPLAPGSPRSRLFAVLRDSLRFGRTGLRLEGGLFAEAGHVQPTAAAALTQALGPLRLFAEVELAAQPTSPLERFGFGPFVDPLERTPAGHVRSGRAGVEVEAGALRASLFAFGHRIDEPVGFYARGSANDTVEVAAAPAPFRQAGLTATWGLRAEAARGFYLSGQATALRFLNENASALHRRAAAARPDVYGRARVGARYVIFRGDLDFDLYLQGRFWSAMRSRTLHPPTGLLVIPPEGAPTFGANGVLDVYFEAQVRTATLFLAYENALGRTAVQTGTLIVPVYPLPARQFRFGIYWPIFN